MKDKDVVAALKLTKEQTDKIDAALKWGQDEQQKLFQESRGQGGARDQAARTAMREKQDKIRAEVEKMIAEGFHQNQVTVLERLVQTVADRGREALFFCDLAVFFRKAKEEKAAHRMLQNAIKEALEDPARMLLDL